MKRTGPGILIGTAAIAAVIGFGVDQLLTAGGRPTIVPDWILAVLLVVIATAVFFLAWPIRRRKNDPSAPRVDPFRALHTAVLARASSLLGSAVGGFMVGLLLFALTRPVTPPVGSMTVIASTAGAAVVLVVAALFAENFCSLPKDDDDHSPGSDGPAAPDPA